MPGSDTETQDRINLSVTSPLGKDKLLLRSFSGEEMLSGLFQFNLEMSATDANLSLDAIVGKHATVVIEMSKGGKRTIDGIVTRFRQAGSDRGATLYSAELRPWFWVLSLNLECRIFQEKSVPDIIKAVFGDLGYTDFKDSLTGTYEPREYCVQYQESAFAFISRLMEEEGIFYFFEHAAGKHTLVLGDDSSAHKPCAGIKDVHYRPTAEGDYETDDRISHCTFDQQVTSGKYATDDFNFETPSTQLYANAAGVETMEVYDYPGLYFKKAQGDAYSTRRLEALEAPKKMLCGDGTVRSFASGFKFTLKDHPRAALNADYVLRWVSHACDTSTYHNSFEALPSTVTFRPIAKGRKVRISGAQTAIVTGKAGEEIWTDKYGRVKCQFHWDQEGKSDEKSSCWIRVAQTWAHNTWGTWFLPRIGMEVLVTFLDGDPDRPLVTGCVYNGENATPYTLPADQTKSTIKSNSSKDAEGFNEIRFEDKAGEEEIYVHAQKDQNIFVENDRTSTIIKGNETIIVKEKDRKVTVEKGNDTHIVEKGDRTINVNTGKEVHTVKSTREVTVTGDVTFTDKANYTQETTGDYKLTVKGNLTIDVTGDITMKAGGKIATEAGSSYANKAGTTFDNKAGTALTNKAGTALTDEAGTSLTIKGGVDLTAKAPMFTVKGDASGTVDGGGMLTVKGGMVKIN